MQWPVASNIGGVPGDAADRMLQSWQVAWNGHALVNQPGDLFSTNTFYPLNNDLAFTDGLIGYAPAGLIGSGPQAAMVRYNLLVLFAYALAFTAAALLARELGLSWPAAVVAGAAFAYAPFRLSHYNHLHVLSSGGIPLTLMLLHRGYRVRAPALVVLGWAAAAWQVSIGFALGLHLVYLLGLLGGVLVLWWLTHGRPRPSRPMVLATVVGASILGSWSAWQAAPYLQVLREYPEAQRIREHVAFYSPPPKALFAAPQQSATWGDITQPIRATLDWTPEMTLFPGATVVLLAIAGLAIPALSGRYRILLGLLAAGTAVLSMGYSVAGGRQVYDLLYDFLPGWQASRTPGRLFTITTLALALLAAGGAHAAARRLRTTTGSSRLMGLALCGLLAVAILFEGRQHLPIGELAVDAQRVEVADPQMHLPSDQHNDPVYVFLSTAGFPQIFNGYSGFVPNFYSRVRREMEPFPSAGSVQRLQSLGIETVVVHLDRARGTPWEGAHQRSIDGLAVSREIDGDVAFFKIDPPGGRR